MLTKVSDRVGDGWMSRFLKMKMMMMEREDQNKYINLLPKCLRFPSCPTAPVSYKLKGKERREELF